MVIRTFGWSFAVTAFALVAAFLYGSTEALFLCAILGVLEVSLSFDNAVVNATVLEKMSEFWQKLFLTVGIVIAVFGMRLVFPLLIVGITARLSPVEAIHLAIVGGSPETPGTYGFVLTQAHPQIAAFGGIFLLMLFLNFIVESRELHWLGPVERLLSRLGRLANAPVVVAGLILILAASYLADEPGDVLLAGLMGLMVYLVVDGLGNLFEAGGDSEAEHADTLPGIAGSADEIAEVTVRTGGPSSLVRVAGKAGFFLFLYLEVLDATFSFDGVIGAFAITSDPIIIALGLGLIGAMFVRSITVFLVRRGTLREYVYLEHGAHWAIGALAVILLLSIGVHVDQIVTGLVGVAFIGAALVSSILRNRRLPADSSDNAGSSLEMAEPQIRL